MWRGEEVAAVAFHVEEGGGQVSPHCPLAWRRSSRSMLPSCSLDGWVLEDVVVVGGCVVVMMGVSFMYSVV